LRFGLSGLSGKEPGLFDGAPSSAPTRWPPAPTARRLTRLFSLSGRFFDPLCSCPLFSRLAFAAYLFLTSAPAKQFRSGLSFFFVSCSANQRFWATPSLRGRLLFPPAPRLGSGGPIRVFSFFAVTAAIVFFFDLCSLAPVRHLLALSLMVEAVLVPSFGLNRALCPSVFTKRPLFLLGPVRPILLLVSVSYFLGTPPASNFFTGPGSCPPHSMQVSVASLRPSSGFLNRE